MSIWKVKFEGMYPVGNTLIISAETREYAHRLACDTVAHTEVLIDDVTEVEITGEPQVIEYLSGDY